MSSFWEDSKLTKHGYSPLKPDELGVLRAQYEKEGPYVGVQTKFNYAWVGDKSTRMKEPAYSFLGLDQILSPRRAARGRSFAI